MTDEEMEALKDFRTPPPSFEDFMNQMVKDIAKDIVEKKADKRFEEAADEYYT